MSNLVRTMLLITFLLGNGIVAGGCNARNVKPVQEMSLKLIVLRDVHPLWGGRNIYLFGDGRLFVQIVVRGARETRYALRVKPSRIEELVSLLREHQFMEIETEDRLGMPDEARPEIEVTWQSGAHKTVAKWANDAHPDFDTIYAWLVSLAEGVTDQTAVYVGPYDENWQPE